MTKIVKYRFMRKYINKTISILMKQYIINYNRCAMNINL